MFTLFLRMYGLLIVALIVSFTVQLQVMDYVWASMPKPDVAGRFTATFHLIERELVARPQEQWSGHLALLATGFRTPVSLEKLDTLRERFKMNAQRFQSLNDRFVLAFDRDGGGFFMARRVGNSDVATLLELPGPPSQRNFFNALNWTIEAIIVAVLLFFWVRPFWRDLSRVNAAAEAAGNGDFEVKIKVGRWSPLSSLAHGFNIMNGRINELLSAHRQLTTALSHELRNPLMRLRFRQSLAREAEALPDKNRNLDEMSGALDELDQLVDEILTYARTKNPGQDIQFEPVELAPWITALEHNAEQLALAQGRAVGIEVELQVPHAEIEPVFMARALSNLLSNAVRYAKGLVRVTVSRQGDQYRLSVEDDGEGVDEKDRENVFEPFWRGDESRSRKTGGFGIGLALVRRIARWHGGDARVHRSPLGGAQFLLHWPVKETSHD